MSAPVARAPFLAAAAGGPRWADAAGAVLRALGPATPDHRVGFVYLSDFYAPDAEDILVFLRRTTGVAHWVGCVGLGVIGPGAELYDQPGMAVMLAPFPQDAVGVFATVDEASDRLPPSDAPVLIVHADPATPDLADGLKALARDSDGFLIGGLSASRSRDAQFADIACAGGISGLALALERQPLVTGLTQGCSPIGPARTVTRAVRNIVVELDGEPALSAFKRDIGPALAADLNRVAGLIFAGLPVPDTDSGDYLVRNLVGIDPAHGALAIAEVVEPGQRVLFCRRDTDSAVADMRRMLAGLRSRLGAAVPRGGLYVSCAARGPGRFPPGARETELIAEAFPDLPLVGFFANGEISRDRLYGYTGVLTLFL